ncbi:MAG: LysR family transcriptional regulator [Proteobacteria bacterium]|nr:LysR family transcriptional regulator [Pseudomonadota bacterium]
MDFNRLHTFIKVAEKGNITNAAEDLYLTQQAVSKQLLLLEDELQLTLVTRTHNSLHLTKEGQILLEQIAPLFQQIGESVTSLQGRDGELGGVIKVGVTPDAVTGQFLKKVRSFKREFPKVRFEIVFDIDYNIESKIISNELDLGILFVFRDQRILTSHHLESREHILCCSEQFQNQHGPFKKYGDLLGAPFIEFTHNFAGFGRWMKINCSGEAKAFMDQQAEVISESVTVNRDLIINGDCMGFLSERVFKEEEKNGDLLKLFPESKPVELEISIVTKKKDSFRLIEKKFRDHLLSTWKET